MADVLSPEQRSRCMSRIRSNNTKPERFLRKLLWAEGLRYRIGYKLPGKPDIVFVGARVAVFVDGCFWHCCPHHGRQPSSNEGYWNQKLLRNQERDAAVTALLEAEGWAVLRFWEHELLETPDAVVKKIFGRVKGASGSK